MPLKGKSTFTLLDDIQRDSHPHDTRPIFQRYDGKLALYQSVLLLNDNTINRP